MRILMFGWEFPPFSTGGLGTACHGLTKGLTRQGIEITLVLPRIGSGKDHDYLRILRASIDGKIKLRAVDSVLKPYVTSEAYLDEIRRLGSGSMSDDAIKHYLSGGGLSGIAQQNLKKGLYGKDLFNEVQRYAKAAASIAAEEEFDIIHCHEWLTYPAGIEARREALRKGKKTPLIAHVHATEFDRTGGNPNMHVYHLEREGMHNANCVLTVSNYTKNIVTRNYGVDPGKVHVVHNAIDLEHQGEEAWEKGGLRDHHKVVLFVGRMTIQKGPDHFIKIAKKISDLDPSVRFVMAGEGDMFLRTVEEAAALGIGDKVLFAEHLSGPDVDKAYRMADVYVMTSISEPFGLTVLEAMKNKTPVIVSKQAGVSEIIKNCLPVDFWDVDEMANKILAVLHYPGLAETLSKEGYKEVSGFSWDQPAKRCIDIYNKALSEVRH